MITIQRKGLIFKRYLAQISGQEVAKIIPGWTRTHRIVIGSDVYIADCAFRAMDNLGFKTKFVVSLKQRNQTLLTLEQDTKLTGVWYYFFTYQGETYQIKFSYGREFKVFKAHEEIGSIRISSSLRRNFEVDLPDAVPLVIQLFLFFLFLTWMN